MAQEAKAGDGDTDWGHSFEDESGGPQSIVSAPSGDSPLQQQRHDSDQNTAAAGMHLQHPQQQQRQQFPQQQGMPLNSSPSFQELEAAIQTMTLSQSESTASFDSAGGVDSPRSGGGHGVHRSHSGQRLNKSTVRSPQRTHQLNHQIYHFNLQQQQNQYLHQQQQYYQQQQQQQQQQHHHLQQQQYSHQQQHIQQQQQQQHHMQHQHQHQHQHQQQQFGYPYGAYGIPMLRTPPLPSPPAEVSTASAREELVNLNVIDEEESRALVLFHSPHLSPVAVRDACQKYGVLYYIRPEFHSKGLTLLSYFDLRASIQALKSLPADLGEGASAHFSIMLHAMNSNAEECCLLISNVSDSCSESDIRLVFQRFGQLKSIGQSFLTEQPAHVLGASKSYRVEYFNIQDARSAASEVSVTCGQLWGPSAKLTFAPTEVRKLHLCRQLLAVLSKWRGESPPSSPMLSGSVGYPYPFPPSPTISPSTSRQTLMLPDGANHSSSTGHFNDAPHKLLPLTSGLASTQVGGGAEGGGEGRVNGGDRKAYKDGASLMAESASGDLYPPLPPMLSLGGGAPPSASTDSSSASASATPISALSAPQGLSSTSASISAVNAHASSSSGLRRSTKGNASSSDSDLTLDMERLHLGHDQRTTVMVRNIPNKYSKQLLIEEINAKHAGTYDFFYLPIDFKNHCNRGYAFINFLDPEHIVSFVRDFHGQRWRSFNSEKICDVSWARIQGKASMVSRFQNSSLLDKDDSFQPSIFSSDKKGGREAFPPSNVGRK